MNALHPSLVEKLRCAACKGALSRGADAFTCAACGARYPVVRGAPIVIDESRSMFRIEDCAATAVEEEARPRTWKTSVREVVERIAPPVGANLSGAPMLARLAVDLRAESPEARVLILGGGSLGVGMRSIVEEPRFLVAESDIHFGPRANVICDAHNIPFADGTFDAVIAQAVFEYMIDPFHVAEEIHRVLRPRGFVYAESPFMQQVHGGAYDFFRFSHLGHRRVFRMFDELESGVVCGPGMALSWSYRYFLRAFSEAPAARALTNFFANLTSNWVTKFDSTLTRHPGSYDAASAFYFLGRRAEKPISDRDIVAGYRGSWKIRR
jgi:SAM-dependent methyltransferase